MPEPNSSRAIHHLRSALGADVGERDGVLLARFADHGDESAFEVLVWRHAGFVQRACRAVLRDHHAAEDVCQAAFLVLARKAGRLRGSATVTGWLYRVARRIAVKHAVKREQGAAQELPEHVPAAPADEPDADTVRIVHEEIARLPERYQLPVIACLIEGLTHAEAASRFGWPLGTVAGRMSRAKQLLERRLSARGIAAGAAVLSAALAPTSGIAVQPAFVAATVAGASEKSVGRAISPEVLHLCRGELKAMFVKRLLTVLVVGTALGTMFALAGVQFWASANGNPAPLLVEKPAPGEEKKAPGAVPTVAEKIEKAYGKETVAVLSGATRVEVFRLQSGQKGPRKKEAKPDPKDVAQTVGSDELRWIISATGKDMDAAFADRLRALVFDEATDPEPFDPEQFSFGPNADVAFRLWKGKESVTVVVNFEEWTFLAVTRDAEGKQTRVIIGELLAFNDEKRTIEKGELFDRAKALAVGAFPEDQKLKALQKPKVEDLFRPPVGDKVPEHLLTMLEKADTFELLSLDPERLKEKVDGDFHGYKILGGTTVKDAEVRKKLVAALKKGVENNDGAAAGCFNPRHGIRLIRDKQTVEFVICFECLYIQVYVDGKVDKQGLRTTSSPQNAFNGVLKDAKVPLPKK